MPGASPVGSRVGGGGGEGVGATPQEKGSPGCGCEVGGQGGEQGNEGGLQKLRKAREWIPPQGLWKGMQPWMLAQWDFKPSELQDNTFMVFFPPPSFWSFVTAAVEN